ncbi:barstar family protein [Antrihabitans spumae]|jgi:hypothetical protein|uniref:Barstar family protein n=1 Tax=Antrihabitans spumae TaxID=3373370 RepID=A0ABW7JN94_9NOCA
MSDIEKILTGSPVVGRIVAARDDGSISYRATELGYLVRTVRGDKMPTVQRLFDEFAAAFQFPDYFGENKDAFDECMRDLDEFVGAAPGYVVVVRAAEQLLSREPEERRWFVDAMDFYAQEWAKKPDPVLFKVVEISREPRRS